MGIEIACENGRLSEFQGLMTLTLTLTLDRVILHTAMHHSWTCTYTPHFIEIEETFCRRTGVRTCGRTFETHFIRLTRRSRPKNGNKKLRYCSWPARRAMSVEILSTAAQLYKTTHLTGLQYRNDLKLPQFDRPFTTSFLLVVCSNNDSIWHRLRDSTTFTVY